MRVKHKNWHISDKEWDNFGKEMDYVYIHEFFINNGIFCNEIAEIIMNMARFTIDDIYNCPFCDSEKVYKLKDNKTYKCANNECYKKFTVTSRTYLDNTKLPPYKIARYCYLIAEMKIINSCVISRDLGVTQKTAWYLVDLARKVARNNNQDVLKFKDISDFMELLLLVVKS